MGVGICHRKLHAKNGRKEEEYLKWNFPVWVELCFNITLPQTENAYVQNCLLYYFIQNEDTQRHEVCYWLVHLVKEMKRKLMQSQQLRVGKLQYIYILFLGLMLLSPPAGL